MKRLDLFSGMFWLIIAGWVCFHARKLDIGTLRNPGPGFIFFWGGILLGVFSLMVLILSIKFQQKTSPKASAPFKNIDWRKVIYILLSLVVYGLILEQVGYLISTFLLISFMLYTIEAKRWYLVVFVATTSSLLSYAIFVLWLQVQLPKGLLGV